MTPAAVRMLRPTCTAMYIHVDRACRAFLWRIAMSAARAFCLARPVWCTTDAQEVKARREF